MKKFIVLLTITLLFGCASSKVSRLHMIENILSSKEFNAYLKVCNQKKDTITIYDNINFLKGNKIKYFSNDYFFKTEKSNYKLNLNTSTTPREDKIAIFKFKRGEKYSEVFFLHLWSNAYIKFVLEDDKIKDYDTGFY